MLSPIPIKHKGKIIGYSISILYYIIAFQFVSLKAINGLP